MAAATRIVISGPGRPSRRLPTLQNGEMPSTPARRQTPRRPTARCPPRRSPASGRGRSASTCTCRSARRAAATATSTPTRAAELAGRRRAGGYADAALAELGARARACSATARPPVETVFFGGGTPTLLPPADLASILGAIDERFGLAPGAEVTTEANPESVDPAVARGAARGRLHAHLARDAERRAARARDARPHAHARAAPPQAVAEARAAGFEHVSLDLIYGTPGETDDDWRASLDAALARRPDHCRAYALIVEPGTRLAAQVRRGELPAPDDDVLADRYELADAALARRRPAAGTRSATGRAATARRCRHNLGYWRGGDWWGVGPGAHSHVGGVRWWNVRTRRPTPTASPACARRTPASCSRTTAASSVMLSLRLAEGLPRVAARRGRGGGRRARRRPAGRRRVRRRPRGTHPARAPARRRGRARPGRLTAARGRGQCTGRTATG